MVLNWLIIQVDMPVFFYIDPEFAEDPKMEHVDSIVLSYTFFESKDGLNIPVPSYVRAHWHFDCIILLHAY